MYLHLVNNTVLYVCKIYVVSFDWRKFFMDFEDIEIVADNMRITEVVEYVDNLIDLNMYNEVPDVYVENTNALIKLVYLAQAMSNQLSAFDFDIYPEYSFYAGLTVIPDQTPTGYETSRITLKVSDELYKNLDKHEKAIAYLVKLIEDTHNKGHNGLNISDIPKLKQVLGLADAMAQQLEYFDVRVIPKIIMDEEQYVMPCLIPSGYATYDIVINVSGKFARALGI